MWRRTSVVVTAFISVVALAQSPTFKGHRIGETAQDFFGRVVIAGNKPASDYCPGYLADQKVMRAYEKSRQPFRIGSFDDFKLSENVDACRQVIAALRGDDVTVDARVTAIGTGSNAAFRGVRLVEIRFPATAQYDEVVADVTKKLGYESGQDEITYQNIFGATFTGKVAVWDRGDLGALVSEHTIFQRIGDLGLFVTVYDRRWLESEKKSRQTTRKDSTD